MNSKDSLRARFSSHCGVLTCTLKPALHRSGVECSVCFFYYRSQLVRAGVNQYLWAIIKETKTCTQLHSRVKRALPRPLWNCSNDTQLRIYYTCSKTRLTENVFTLTPALTLTLTLKRNNVFELTKWRYFSSKWTDTLNFIMTKQLQKDGVQLDLSRVCHDDHCLGELMNYTLQQLVFSTFIFKSCHN